MTRVSQLPSRGNDSLAQRAFMWRRARRSSTADRGQRDEAAGDIARHCPAGTQSGDSEGYECSLKSRSYPTPHRGAGRAKNA